MEVSPNSIFLVSCVSRKSGQSCPAKDLYISDWFRKARQYVESTGCQWFVLSAQYGLVKPNQIIAPYDRTLNEMTVSERRVWAKKVFDKLLRAVPNLSHVVFLAGNRYRDFLILPLTAKGIFVSIPMKGLGIGKQLSWLKKNAIKQ